MTLILLEVVRYPRQRHSKTSISRGISYNPNSGNSYSQKAEPQDKEQSAKFIETAKKIKDDDDKEKFDKACTTILIKKQSH